MKAAGAFNGLPRRLRGNMQGIDIRPEPKRRKVIWRALATSSAGDPSYRHSRQYERDYNDISHVCCPISTTLNRKAEREWHRKKKENDVT
jgi:hypothetical protein